MDELRAEAQRALDEAVAVVDELRTELDGHAAAVAAPPPAAVTAGAPSAQAGLTSPAGFTAAPASSPMGWGGTPPAANAGFAPAEADVSALPLPDPEQLGNGQVVLIPRAVVQRIGNIDPAFVQLMGDFDYGLRERAAGCSVWVAPGTLANCAPHPEHRTDQQPVVDEWRRLWSNGELVPGPWAVYSRRWAGRLWPLYWLSPYVRRGFRIVFERTPRRRTLARRR